MSNNKEQEQVIECGGDGCPGCPWCRRGTPDAALEQERTHPIDDPQQSGAVAARNFPPTIGGR